ncbi:hypothetical protein GOBAR_DD04365 [Gossypium barbadense]|nr:hypothetical protein GOBAR_DD04365 [Gossypium barbadense]
MDVNVTWHTSKDEVTAVFTTKMARKIGCFLKEREKVFMATKPNRGQQLITIQVKGTFDMEIETTCSTAELHAGDNIFATTITSFPIGRKCEEYESAWMDAMIDQLLRNALHARVMKEKHAFYATVGRRRRRRRADLFTNRANHFIFLVGINKF